MTAGTTCGSGSSSVSRSRGGGAEAADAPLGGSIPPTFWRRLAAPTTIWLLLFFVVPFYVVVSVAFGTVDPVFRSPLPVWQPWWWTTVHMEDTLAKVIGPFAPTYLRTVGYVALASALCLLIGYPVAYYVARYGGRRRGLLLLLLIAPFWISYLMRMVAWRNLLFTDGYVNRLLEAFGLAGYPWLDGRSITVVLGLVYGYIPYMILPLFAFLDRIDPRLLEAGRDLGADARQTFLRVTLPLSRPAILAGLVVVALPMFGDYYTNDLLSSSPRTAMIGNVLDNAVNTTGQGPEAASLTLVLLALLAVPIGLYVRAAARAPGKP
jgi:ABC-type spermidine/putrescine transport system permease subunit I